MVEPIGADSYESLMMLLRRTVELHEKCIALPDEEKIAMATRAMDPYVAFTTMAAMARLLLAHEEKLNFE